MRQAKGRLQPLRPRGSGSQEVWEDPLVAVFISPQSQRNRREIIHHWDGVAILRKVDRAQKMVTGVASFDANVRKLFRNKYRQRLFVVFAAVRAKKSAKLPFRAAERAQQESLSAVTFRAEYP